MKIGIQTWGSDGDVLPFVALAAGLSARGYEVTLAFTSADNTDYSHYGKTHNFKIIQAHKFFETKLSELVTQIGATRNPVRQLSLLFDVFYEPATQEMYEVSEKLCKENDLVIGHFVCHTLLTASQKHDCPRIAVNLFPLGLFTLYNSPLNINFGKFLNKIIWRVADYLMIKDLYLNATKIRIKEGLSVVKSLQKELFTSGELTILAMSEVFIEKMPDWQDKIFITGSFNLQETKEPASIPNDLEEFLSSGEPPIYYTFGSLTQCDYPNNNKLFLESAKLTGKRAIIQSNLDNSSLPEIYPNIYFTKRLPHDLVFPRCSLVVHHGGAGTSQTTLKAGMPSIVVAHGFDQPFWGQKLEKIGVGGKTLRRTTVKAKRLSREILKILETPKITEQAQKHSKNLPKENGVKTAIELIEERFS